jgi:hypothetical protein
MPLLTLNQAAKVAEKSKSTLLGAIKSKRLSAFKTPLNQWQIDPDELFRVYPPRFSHKKPPGTVVQSSPPKLWQKSPANE